MIKFLQNYKISILLFTIFLSIYGIGAVLTLTREAQPSINIPNYIVSIVYPGADVETINDQVVSKLEQKFRSISMIKKVNSTCASNMGIITLEFHEKKTDVDASNDIKSTIDQLYSTFPSDVKYPTFKKIDINDQPIYNFSISGPMPIELLYTHLEKLEDDLKSIPGVGDVTIIGKPIKEIRIEFNADLLSKYELDIGFIINQLKSSFIKFPADKKNIHGNLYSYEVTNYPNDLPSIVSNIENFELINKDNKSIKIYDIAKVYLSYKNQSKKSFIVQNMDSNNSINAISFAIKKIPGADILNITELIKTKIDSFMKENKDLTFVETMSMQEMIQKIYDLFFENFFETGLLVFIVILIFLGLKSSLVISLGFFIVYLINFIFFKVIGFSFNNIISFSLILVLGIMVDNLIVIAQGIVVGLKENNNNIWLAIQSSLRNYGKAIIFGTLTTIVIFVPLYLGLSGIIGQFIKYLPVTIMSNLSISLVVTIIILPVLFVYLFSSTSQFKSSTSLNILEKIGIKFAGFYYKINSYRIGTLSIILFFWGLLIFSFVLVATGYIKVDFFGNGDSNNVWINIKYAAGISLDKNQEFTNEISPLILEYLKKKYGSVIKYVSIDLGSDRSSNNISAMLRSSGTTNNISSFTIRLLQDKERPIKIKSFQIVEDINNTILKDLKAKFAYIDDIYALTLKNGPGGGKAVGFYIVGDNYLTINNYIENVIKPAVEKIPGIYNISTSIEYTNGKIRYLLDENKARQLGVNNLSTTLMLIGLKNGDYWPNGIKIKEFNEFGDDNIPVNAYVMLGSGNIDYLKVGNIYLAQLIKEKKLEPELLSINKTDGDLAIEISADKKEGVALADVITQIQNIINNNPLPAGLKYKPAGDIESQATTSRELGISILTGIALMFLVLIIQFNNVKYAFVIITSILLSISGALLILGIFGLKFDFVAQLGIFGVFGVGVNQALIHLEDFKEFYEKDGMSVIDSFRKSISLRFIPIFLTKAVTIIGLMILAIKDEFFATLAVAFIGGLFVSFFITLLYIPSLMKAISKTHYNGYF